MDRTIRQETSMEIEDSKETTHQLDLLENVFLENNGVFTRDNH